MHIALNELWRKRTHRKAAAFLKKGNNQSRELGLLEGALRRPFRRWATYPRKTRTHARTSHAHAYGMHTRAREDYEHTCAKTEKTKKSSKAAAFVNSLNYK